MSRRSLSLLVLFSAVVLGTVRSQAVPPGEAPPPFSPFRLWTLLDDDGSANWTAEFVSLGNHGTQVFCHRSNYVTGAMLLSAHDGDPPAPVWSTSTHPADPEAADSAATAGLHASLTRLSTGALNDYWFTVRLYDSLGERWSWTYPQVSGGRSGLDFSRNGSRLVVAIQNRQTGGNDLLLFDPAVPEPVATWPLPGGVVWSMDLAEEASWVVLGLGSLVHVADALTGETVWQWDWGSASLSNVSLTLSADAGLFAYGDHNSRLHVRRWNGVAYEGLITRNLPEEHSGARCIRFSRDGSRCAYGVVHPYPSTVVYTECVAVPSGDLLLSDRIESGGAYQNSCMDLAFSEDGLLIAVAQAGDQTGEQPEFRIYAADGSVPFPNPIYTLDLPGSALNVDVAPDGRTFLVGSREVHINVLGAGGRIDLVAVHPEGLWLEGTPVPGHAGTLALRLAPFDDLDASPWLLWAVELADEPIPLGGGGLLLLDPAKLRLLPLPPLAWVGSPGHPETSIDFSMPPDPGLLGLTLHLQGLTVRSVGSGPLRTAWNAFPLTVLPAGSAGPAPPGSPGGG